MGVVINSLWVVIAITPVVGAFAFALSFAALAALRVLLRVLLLRVQVAGDEVCLRLVVVVQSYITLLLMLGSAPGLHLGGEFTR